ncbi:MAG TPA: ABC transporter ATP-binding protein [Clostridia bacterium]|nr:ABC transporter ATP-binding protein [Clostridia bacterium]
MVNLVVEHLKYRYPLGNELALEDISFEVKKGEFIGIIGENGSGKSTLCQAIVGLVPNFYKGAYGGKVLVKEIEVAQSDVSEISSYVGIVFQNPFTQITGSKLTVYEEVAFGLENLGIPREEMIKRIEESLKLLRLFEYRHFNPFELSGGQMQRLAIASVIAMKPDILVLDEPTSQLDPQGSEEVFQAIQDLAKNGMTIIIAEHKIEKIASYADKIILLHKGKLVDFDTPEKIFSREDIEEYGIVPPVYTRICKSLNVKNEAGFYPVTLEQVYYELVKVYG